MKILDFGIAKLTRPDTPAAAARSATPTATIDTDPGLVMGTAGYMAPEQVRGQPTDHRADIFALGAILYEMLSGRRAFHGETSAETMTAILREEPPELSRDGRPLPPALDRIVRHCLEKSPQERFQSASDVAFALEALSGISDSGPKPKVAAPGSRRRFLAPALMGLILLAAGSLVGRYLAPPRNGAPVSYRKLTFGRGTIKLARFSGDGHTVYYGAAWDGGSVGIYSCDLTTPGSVSIAAPPLSYLAGVSRSNELAILLRYQSRPHESAQGTLARMTPGGAPREILGSVTEADWSPDGSSLAVVHLLGNRSRLEYPIGTVLFESSGWITHMRVSPDGRSVAFLDHSVFPDDRGSVMVVSAPGHARGLSPTYSSAQGLAWSPSGREIFFSGATVGSSRSIYAVNLAGRVRTVASLPNSGRVHDISQAGDVLITGDNVSTGVRVRAPGENTERDLTWLDWSFPGAISRDGRTLLFGEQGEGGGPHYTVCLRGMDGSPPIRLGEGQAEDLSPDGTWALTTRFWTHPPEQVLLPTGAGQPRTLPPIDLENIAGSEFFPSGDRLLLVGNERGHGVRAYVRDLDGGPLRPVTGEGMLVRQGLISPDGRWVAGWVRGSEGATLYPVEGGEKRPVPGRLPNEAVVGWSRDGRSLYVTGQPRGEVYRVDIATGTRTLWAKFTGPEDRAGSGLGLLILGRDDHTYAYAYTRYLSELFLARGMR